MSKKAIILAILSIVSVASICGSAIPALLSNRDSDIPYTNQGTGISTTTTQPNDKHEFSEEYIINAIPFDQPAFPNQWFLIPKPFAISTIELDQDVSISDEGIDQETGLTIYWIQNAQDFLNTGIRLLISDIPYILKLV